jgi:hypothetical protein
LWDYFDLVWGSFADIHAVWVDQHSDEYELADDRREDLP